MDAVVLDEFYSLVKQYVEPELLILIPILLFFGWMMKRTPNISNWTIPYVNTIVAIAGGIQLVETIEDGVIQGILVSALATLTYNMYNQWKKQTEE